MTTTPQSPDRNAAADVLVQRVATNIRANLGSLPSMARTWADDLAAALRSSAVVVTEEMVRDAMLEVSPWNYARIAEHLTAALNPEAV